MSITFQAEAPPLRRGAWGAIRVGDSRVLLGLVIRAFEDGVTAESIVQRYPTVSLADVYGAIAYALHHPAEVAAYLAGRERQAEDVRERIEAAQGDLGEIRRRILARKGA